MQFAMSKWKLDWFKSGEYQVIREKLTDLQKKGIAYNPARKQLFAAMDATPFQSVKVAIFGQDPYPNPIHATGIAFDVPEGVSPLPPTLINIFREYQDDLGLPQPIHGSLEPWTSRGVFLWNSCPVCISGRPGSCSNWPEWEELNREIIERSSQHGCVFIFLGARARSYSKFVDRSKAVVIETSHPSPLGANKGFFGSKIFSRANAGLEQIGLQPIDWRLT